MIEALQYHRISRNDGKHRFFARLGTLGNQPQFILPGLLCKELAFPLPERVFGAFHFGLTAGGFSLLLRNLGRDSRVSSLVLFQLSENNFGTIASLLDRNPFVPARLIA